MKRFNLKAIRMLVATLALSVAAPSFAAPLDLNELRIGTIQEFENMNPMIMSMVATTYINFIVNRNTLVTINGKGQWIPLLAESIPTLKNGGAKIITENGVKKVQAVWMIRKEAVWGDGTPVTGHDVEFSRQVALSDNVSVGDKEQYSQIEKIVVDPANPKKMTFTYEKAKWDYWQLGTVYIVPKHLEEAVFKQYGSQKEGYDKNSKYTSDPTNKGLYNGPYVVSDLKLGSHVEMVPNAKWWGEKPKFKKIVIKLIPNTATLEANVESGNIHVTPTTGFMLDQALQFERKIKAKNLPYVVKYRDALDYEHIDLNLDNPLLKDVRVRKALVYAIDREGMVKALFEGKQKVAHHFISKEDVWYTEDSKVITKYEYNPKKAAQLLEEAGFKAGADGIRAKDGQRLSLVISTTAGNKNRENVQAFLQNQFKKVGIELIIKNFPARVFFGEIMNKRKFEAMGLYTWSTSPENNPKSTLSIQAIPTEANGWSGQNYPGWKNATADDLIMNKLDLEFDSAKRKAFVAGIIKEYTNDVPVIPMFSRVQIMTVPTNMTNIEPTGHQFPDTQNVEKWSVK